jgi:hypothetical protein
MIARGVQMNFFVAGKIPGKDGTRRFTHTAVNVLKSGARRRDVVAKAARIVRPRARDGRRVNFQFELRIG